MNYLNKKLGTNRTANTTVWKVVYAKHWKSQVSEHIFNCSTDLTPATRIFFLSADIAVINPQYHLVFLHHYPFSLH